MCTAIREMIAEGELRGKQEGAIQGTIQTYSKFHQTWEVTMENIRGEFSLSEDEAAEYMKKYWKVSYPN